VLFDFARTEVRAIEVGKSGEVYAIANEIPGGSFAPPRKGKTGTQPAGPVPKPPKTKGKGTLYRFETDGTPDQLLDDKEEHYTSLSLAVMTARYVGTGVEAALHGRRCAQRGAHRRREERQIGAASWPA
jgi:hypothetical protein